MNNIQPNTIVRLKMVCLGNGAGSIGICYKSHNAFGYSLKGSSCSILFENGNHDDFTIDDQADFLIMVGQTGLAYQYTDNGKLDLDYSQGLFDSIFAQYDRTFEQAKRLRILGGRHD